MRKSVIKTSALALAFLLLPSLAAAAGLGKLTVLSGLGQPLKAEIELLALQKGEADNLSVRLPSADAFRKANIEYSGALLSVKFSIQQRGENRYVVVLSSTQPMNEPFLDLLVELDWTTGRLVREYTFLLDPPEYKGTPSAPAVAAPVTGTAAIKSVELPKQVPSIAPAPRADRPPVAAAPAAAAPSAAPKAAPKAVASYTVKRGDTLTKIATANKSAGVSLQQMLIALYRSNADAFDENNINRMRAGKILNIPDSEAAASINQDEAVRTVLAQGTEFNEYRRKLGAAVAGAPERDDKRRQSASGKITARVEDKPAVAKDAPDQLRLSKPQEPGKTGAKGSAQGVQEDLLAKEKALKDANERIAMLEKNVQDMRKLLELKSQAGAQMQGQAAKAVEPAKAPAPAKVPEPAKVAETVKAPDAAKTPAPASAEAPSKVTPPAAAPKPAPKPAPKVVAPPPPPETSLIDEILGNELALYGGGGFLLLLFAGYGYYAWRRKKSLQSMESSVMATPDLASDSVFGAAGGAKIDTGPSEIQGEFGQGGAAAAMDTEEVDPIAEADVYMAYGRDAQAEDILKEALAKNPSRLPIRAKLLEIYANRKDTKGFEAQAVEIHAATNGDGTEWNKAVTLGAQLDPGNPLYGGKAGGGADAAVTDTQVISGAEATPDIVLDMGGETQASPELDFDLGLSEPEPGAAPQAEPGAGPGAAPATEITGDLGFDLDLGEGDKAPEGKTGAVAADTPVAPASEVAVPAEAAASIDFDFELPTPGTTAPELPLAAPQAPAAAADGASIDFDFNLDLPAEKEEAPSAPLDLSAISLDLGAPGEAAPAPDAHWQEVATKLDLAKAYQEMGDKDGSRELLNEVLKEGDAAQQQQAQTMLAALG